jgi:hypothetical protein
MYMMPLGGGQCLATGLGGEWRETHHGAGPNDGDVAGAGERLVGAVVVLEDTKGIGETWSGTVRKWCRGGTGLSKTHPR